ncbi:hypothetical protein JXB37_01290 [candidate division WOR-3 bacterium]|nr:hypothetical protein [candidate division WOR-3 bacterium]
MNADGSALALGGNEERPVVVVFWADWAAPAIALLERLNDLEDAARVVAVRLDCPAAPAGADTAAAYEPTVAVGDTVVELFGVEELPTVVVFDRDGAELARFVGYGPGLVADIRSALGADVPAGGGQTEGDQ